ncbi:DUF1525 domain-containing protein [Vibrio sp.]|uniref:DUF1525 domain-containing protein n=1 Tax=Vibrio sp. TaxID=678 RepID=UPI003D149C9B
MLRHVLMVIVIIGSLFNVANASENIKVNKVVWLTTTQAMSSGLDNARKEAGAASFHPFAVDQSKLILTHFQSTFPAKLNKEPESVKMAYLQKNVTPYLKAYSPELLRSQLGISLAKLYQVTRIPAVVINDHYIAYGVSVKEAIDAFNQATAK